MRVCMGKYTHIITLNDITIHFLTLANQQIRYGTTRKVGCQPGDCKWPISLPLGFVWACMGKHTHVITPEAYLLTKIGGLKKGVNKKDMGCESVTDCHSPATHGGVKERVEEIQEGRMEFPWSPWKRNNTY